MKSENDELCKGEKVRKEMVKEILILLESLNKSQKECDSKEESYNNCYFAYKYWKDKAREYKHRAEVAERALRNAAPRLKCRGGLSKGFCRVDKCDYYHCNNDEGCVKAHLQQAEKELAEEV